MSRFSVLSLPLGILLCVYVFIVFSNYRIEGMRELQKQDLDISVNYAVDAAVDKMLDTSKDLELDYADFEYLTINPEVALETYVQILLRNLGYAPSSENKQLIKTNCTPCFIVACYDGYYVGAPVIINEEAGTRDLLFSEKKAYSHKVGNILYSLNLGAVDCKKIENGVITKVPIASAGLTERDVRNIINSQITIDFMSTVYKNNESAFDLRHELILPAMTTKTTFANDIKSPSVLAYVNNINIGWGEPIETYGIGGARITHTDFVGVYTRVVDGVTRKYYCPTRLKPDNIEFLHIYETPKEAAKNGYEADIRYME